MSSKTVIVLCLIVFLSTTVVQARPGLFGSSSSRVENLDSDSDRRMGTTPQSRTRKILKNVAIGAGVGALAAGVYGLYKHG